MRLYAIRYAENFKYGTYDSVYRDIEEKGKKIEKFAFLYYLAEHEGKYTLIDTGFRDKTLATNMGVTLLDVEQELLNVFGKIPQIHKVILTHSHWDHVNNLDLYQGASVVLSQETYNSIMQEGEIAVKNAFVNSEGACTCPKDFPVCVCGNVSKGSIVTRKPILPSKEELENNNRAHSAKMRVIRKR